ncbi:hypothetical protein SERLA73DRAFT_158433 [Serpula lacrymans var. lacrymans S7.3]|uniref:F-box domain-containing protein n=2 Tax=Serpula lacrymans var. lacrymans TaxID=341189 RepID=F8PIX2_SERL3|nr:hypothetical protein SERLA73DRAFT_158433 [Serpula lacrymans var. lacrymans S7.3]
MDNADWGTFVRYAHRVKSIVIHNDSLFGNCKTIDVSILRALSMPPIPPASILFPQLRQLVCYDRRDEIYPFVRLLFGPKLTKVDVRLEASRSAQLAVLPSLAAWCPSVKKAELRVWRERPLGAGGINEVRALSDVVCKWRHLEQLSCGVGCLDDKAILHLGKLNSLRSLQLRISSHLTYHSVRQAEHGPLFQFLDHIHMVAIDSLSSCTSFFPLFSSLPPNITISPYAPYRSEGLCDLFTDLSVHESSGVLEDVSVEDHFQSTAPEEVFTIETLRPLLGLHRLRILSLETFYSFSLDDNALKEIGSAFPLLAELSLTADRGSNRHSKISVNGLITLLGLCPHLTSLSLTIDATRVDDIEPERRPGGGISNLNIDTLRLNDSKINHPRIVAAILFDVLPYVDVFAWEWGAHFDESDAEIYRPRWVEVQALLGAFRTVQEWRQPGFLPM